MSILDKTAEELFDFSDVDPEIEDILEEEYNHKKYQRRYEEQFPKALDWALSKDSELTKLIADFDNKFDTVPAYEFLLRAAIMEMLQYGCGVNLVYQEVGQIIDEIQSFSAEDEYVD